MIMSERKNNQTNLSSNSKHNRETLFQVRITNIVGAYNLEKYPIYQVQDYNYRQYGKDNFQFKLTHLDCIKELIFLDY